MAVWHDSVELVGDKEMGVLQNASKADGLTPEARSVLSYVDSLLTDPPTAEEPKRREAAYANLAGYSLDSVQKARKAVTDKVPVQLSAFERIIAEARPQDKAIV